VENEVKKHKMGFYDIPKVLQNMVCEFAFATNWPKTLQSLQMCEEIARRDISPVFLRQQVWSWSYESYLPNPNVCFEPIEQLTGVWSDIIDWHAVNELLFRLDFRRNIVKSCGSRKKWFEKFRRNWLNITEFDAFYRVLLHVHSDCFKPTYVTQRADQLSSTRSPLISARWLLLNV